MAQCALCKKEMLTADGCSSSMLIIDVEMYARITYGDSMDLYYTRAER